MDSENKAEREYHIFDKKRTTFMLVLSILIFITIVISVGLGTYKMSPITIIRCLFGLDSGSVESVLIWHVRMPRIVAGILIGSVLAISGAVMQSVLRNPLASPYTLGISNAAAFGAAFALMASYWGIFESGAISEYLSGPYGMSIMAFLFSILAVTIILMLSRLTAVTPEAMVLMGVALSAIFSAALSTLQYFADDQTLAAMVYWQFGDLSKPNWSEIGIMFVAWIPTVGYFLYKRWDYNAMDADEDIAKSMGINVRRERLIGLILASVSTAVCVSIAGIIGFVGLLGPHLVRRIIGNDNRFLMPASMLVGALILLLSDYFGRMAFDFILPVGIITSFLGGPLFIYILIRGYKKNDVC